MINIMYKIDSKTPVKHAILGKLSNSFNPILRDIYSSHIHNGIGLQMQELRSIEKEIEIRFNSSGARRYGNITSVIHFVSPIYGKIIPVSSPTAVITCEITVAMSNDEVFHLENDVLVEIEREVMKYNNQIANTTDDLSELPDRMVLADGLDSSNVSLIPEEADEFNLFDASSVPLMPLKNTAI